ncbi:MAG: AMP-binding protein [Betaproteobacteria bacterium]|nr:AMP-binding protein [Betaproteobacteria bacterium]
MITLPLVRACRDDAVFAYRNRQPISMARFLSDIEQLAALLPARRYILNLCADRYHFVVGFFAALLRQQISLLPPNHTPDLIGQLGRTYADVYCLTDDANHDRTLETVFYPASSGPEQAVPSVPRLPADQIAAIVFTSGSTGQPVPNEKSWGGLVHSAAAEIDRLGLHAYPGMAVLGTVPPQHMYGLESTVLMVMQGGLALHAGRPFYPADILAELTALPRPRCLVTTPIHLRALLAEPAALPPLDFLLCATAPLPPQLAAAAETRFAAPLYEIYGCTEAGQIATRRTVETIEWRALPGIKLCQDAQGTWVNGGHVETAVLLHDVIELRGPGRFLLHGRTADLVNIAGKRTSLASLNYHLNSISGVRDGVFVMPEQNDVAATRLTAFVVAPGLTRKAVINALRQRVDAAFLPRPLCLVASLPRNDTGKLPREALCRLVAEYATQPEQS